MGLLTGVVGLPLLPLKGVIWVAEHIREEAEAQYYDPVRIRAQLEEVDEARRDGTLSEEEAEELEDELLERLQGPPAG
ncbi:gas vesicle protein GvpG [Geodermatophilus ruber]|uniref:Gas vesicle protein G n=1 Tax=Geodermatophilus ruber TaxID=504800 RepID=A0A1I4CFM5_9ACTN|nr:gas vesicle protein GvpG [Geodermatophilus ruber]SFK79410.1 Gas vesicle protein G [Geodermatophilus ruber]